MPAPVVDPSLFERSFEERIPEWARAHTSALDARMQTVIGEISAERCVLRTPVAGNTQPFLMWHGGASGVLVETAGSLAANAHAQQFGKAAVGVDLNVTHHRTARSGHVTAIATPLHLGRQVASYRVELYDDEGRLMGSGRLTCQLVTPQVSRASSPGERAR